MEQVFFLIYFSFYLNYIFKLILVGINIEFIYYIIDYLLQGHHI